MLPSYLEMVITSPYYIEPEKEQKTDLPSFIELLVTQVNKHDYSNRSSVRQIGRTNHRRG